MEPSESSSLQQEQCQLLSSLSTAQEDILNATIL